MGSNAAEALASPSFKYVSYVLAAYSLPDHVQLTRRIQNVLLSLDTGHDPRKDDVSPSLVRSGVDLQRREEPVYYTRHASTLRSKPYLFLKNF